LSHKAAKDDRKEIKAQRGKIWALRRRVSKLLPGTRIADCQKYPIPTKGDRHDTAVHICSHRETRAAFFANLQSCGSIWACIFCATKITEKRKAELLEVKKKCEERGLNVYMLVLTFRHNRSEKLAELLMLFFKALDYYFFNRAFWRDYKKIIGLLHSIKVLEVTHSDENGWHVHIHMLLICKPFDTKTGEFYKEPCEFDILGPWQSACGSAGLGVPDFHGVKVTSHSAITGYVAKWGLESELTKQHIKRGREGHHTPFDLVRKCEFEGDAQAGKLFKEYYRCFKGRRQMVKSRGFNEFFGLGKYKTDFELANEAVEESELIEKVNTVEWKIIKYHQAQEEILEAAEISGSAGVRDVLGVLFELPSPFREGMQRDSKEKHSRGS
jgi:hypothetical protein